MSDIITHRAAATAGFTPSSSTGSVLADALGRIITGRPLPEGLRPQAVVTAAPATVEEGIAGILAGA